MRFSPQNENYRVVWLSRMRRRRRVHRAVGFAVIAAILFLTGLAAGLALAEAVDGAPSFAAQRPAKACAGSAAPARLLPHAPARRVASVIQTMRTPSEEGR